MQSNNQHTITETEVDRLNDVESCDVPDSLQQWENEETLPLSGDLEADNYVRRSTDPTSAPIAEFGDDYDFVVNYTDDIGSVIRNEAVDDAEHIKEPHDEQVNPFYSTDEHELETTDGRAQINPYQDGTGVDSTESIVNVTLFKRDVSSEETTWAVVITHAGTTQHKNPIFYKETDKRAYACEFIDRIVGVRNTPIRGARGTFYHDVWSNVTTLTSDSNIELKEPTDNDTNTVDVVSDAFHEARLKSEDEETTVAVDYALRAGKGVVALKFSVYGDTYVVELPRCGSIDSADAFDLHDSIIQSSTRTKDPSTQHVSKVTLRDYISSQITVTVTDETCESCRINGFDTELNMYSIYEYAEKKVTGETVSYSYSHPHTKADLWAMSNTHHAITVTSFSDGEICRMIERTLKNEYVPCGSPTGVDNGFDSVLPDLSLVATEKHSDSLITCTASLVEEKTTEEKFTVKFTIDGLPHTFEQSYDAPVNGEVTDTAMTVVNHLGGGEVKFIDGVQTYLAPSTTELRESSVTPIATTRQYSVLTDQQHTQLQQEKSIKQKIHTYSQIKRKISKGKQVTGLAMIAAFAVALSGMMVPIINPSSVSESFIQQTVIIPGQTGIACAVLLLILFLVNDRLTCRIQKHKSNIER